MDSSFSLDYSSCFKHFRGNILSLCIVLEGHHVKYLRQYIVNLLNHRVIRFFSLLDHICAPVLESVN